jgi:hypothetical protein
MPVRYYEYVSAAKVAMLYPQIDASPRASTSSEIGVDLKVAKASRRVEHRESSNLYSKVAAVENWIYANEPIGTVDDPNVWIYGRIPLRTAVFSPGDDTDATTDTGKSAVLYGAQDGNASLIMIGSAKHLVIRHPEAEAPQHALVSFSDGPAVGMALGAFYTNLRQHPANIDQIEAGTSEVEPPFTGNSINVWPIKQAFSDCYDIREAVDRLQFPVGEFEFLAKRLKTIAQDGLLATVSTPLFVARAD